jgi:hypothetical protein
MQASCCFGPRNDKLAELFATASASANEDEDDGSSVSRNSCGVSVDVVWLAAVIGFQPPVN